MTATDDFADVPERYRGLWRRLQLDVPGLRDTTTWAHWLQTARWHADLRVPDAARPAEVVGAPSHSPHPALALQTGFFGRTEVYLQPAGERCTWHRQLDVQPDRGRPDTGWMVFEQPDCVVETGLHGDFREVWQRVPGSTGRTMVLAELAPSTGDAAPLATHGARWLLSGQWLMRVRARRIRWSGESGAALWPADTAPGDTLATVVFRHPESTAALLDFEISFGRWCDGVWAIERSTLPALEGRRESLGWRRLDDRLAEVTSAAGTERWQVLEWSDGP
jgi:hypothetical protein